MPASLFIQSKALMKYNGLKYNGLAKGNSLKYSGDIGITVVEFEDFTKFATKNPKSEENEDLMLFLSANPEAGVIIPGTGGVRKIRWAAKGKGKRGGVRIIYYYHDGDMPLLLLTGFAKNEMKDLNPADRNAMKKIILLLVEQYGRRP
jgi:hypothetical protein